MVNSYNLAMVGLLIGVVVLGLGRLGSFSPLLDVLAHLSSHALGLAAASALALAWSPAQRGLVLATGVAAIVILHAGLGLLAASGKPFKAQVGYPGAIASAPAGGLKILAANTWHSNGDLPGLTAHLLASDADIVMLSEFGPSKLAVLESLKSTYPYVASCAEQWYCSLALLSKVPFISSKVIATARDQPGVVMATLRLAAGLKEVTVIGAHIYRPSLKPRLHWAHLKFVAELAAAQKTPVVVAGDFNATPYSAGFEDFVRRSGLRPIPGVRPTWPAWPVAVPQFAIDHVFTSPSLAIADFGIASIPGSDHLGVWALVQSARE